MRKNNNTNIAIFIMMIIAVVYVGMNPDLLDIREPQIQKQEYSGNLDLTVNSFDYDGTSDYSVSYWAHRDGLEWDISSIPDSAAITGYTIQRGGQMDDMRIYDSGLTSATEYSYRISSWENSDFTWHDDGTKMYIDNTYYECSSDYDVSTCILNDDWFAVGISYDGSNYYEHQYEKQNGNVEDWDYIGMKIPEREEPRKSTSIIDYFFNWLSFR